jgi:hypothetical protein
MMDSAKSRLYELPRNRGKAWEGSRGAQDPLDQRVINPMAKNHCKSLY